MTPRHFIPHRSTARIRIVETVQIGFITAIVPPGTFKHHSTVPPILVIIPVFGTKLHSIVIIK